METPKWKGFTFWYWGFPVISKVFPVISICHCLSVRVRQWSFSRTAQGPRKSKDSWECQRHNPAAMWWTRPDAMQSPIRVKRRHVCPQHHAGLQAHSGIVFADPVRCIFSRHDREVVLGQNMPQINVRYVHFSRTIVAPTKAKTGFDHRIWLIETSGWNPEIWNNM